MQDSTPRATGIFARLRAHLRGDRYMVGSSEPTAVTPHVKPDPVAIVPEPTPPPAEQAAVRS